MNNVFILRPKKPQVWHGLYFIRLRDRNGMSEEQGAQQLRLMAKAIRPLFADLDFDLDEDSLNVYQPNE